MLPSAKARAAREPRLGDECDGLGSGPLRLSPHFSCTRRRTLALEITSIVALRPIMAEARLLCLQIT
jgi:hypothetical protein